ncbi:MAG: hypothetical protein WBR26_19505 [Candidatus Acidiferrum sp.]
METRKPIELSPEKLERIQTFQIMAERELRVNDFDPGVWIFGEVK